MSPLIAPVRFINQGIEAVILTDVVRLQPYNSEAILTVVVSLVREKLVSERGIWMADKKGLRMFGLALGAVTIAVALVAAVTVQAQINSGTTPAAASLLTLSR
jgi:hypothetical protein